MLGQTISERVLVEDLPQGWEDFQLRQYVLIIAGSANDVVPDAVGVEMVSQEPLVFGTKALLSSSTPADADEALEHHAVPDPSFSVAAVS